MRMITVAGFVMLFSAFSLAGCNTIEGVGKDVESVGETVAEEAR